MNRYRWAALLVVLTPLGLAAWMLLAGSPTRMAPKRLPAAIPAPVEPAAPPAYSGDEDLVA